MIFNFLPLNLLSALIGCWPYVGVGFSWFFSSTSCFCLLPLSVFVLFRPFSFIDPPSPPQLTSPMRPLCQTPPCPLWKIPDWSSPLLSFPLLSSFPPSRCLPPSPPSPPPPPAVTLFLSPRATSPTSWPRRWPTSRAWWRTWTPSPQRHEHALAPKHHTQTDTHTTTHSLSPPTHTYRKSHTLKKKTQPNNTKQINKTFGARGCWTQNGFSSPRKRKKNSRVSPCREKQNFQTET